MFKWQGGDSALLSVIDHIRTLCPENIGLGDNAKMSFTLVKFIDNYCLFLIVCPLSKVLQPNNFFGTHRL